MNQILINPNSSVSTISNSSQSTLTQRHETHLQMEDSTNQQLESVPYEWSQETNITVIGK